MLLPQAVQSVLRQFSVDELTLRQIRDAMRAEFQVGLEKGPPASSVSMLPSFVPELPDGSETGKYVAIDLSGKNLRIMLLTLSDNSRIPEEHSQNFIVTNSVMTGTGEQLFNFIVNRLAKFLRDIGLVEANLAIGFVFSYPCELHSIRSARLLWWTKGFNIDDCLHKDVVKLLEEALDLNMSVKARVKAVMNDTVGQLAAAAYQYGPECTIGVVIGYGCNSSYLEDVHRIKKFNAEKAGYSHPKMVVVTEWEEFGAKGELEPILTDYDREIDTASVHKGKQIIDKLIGALYLGELVRRVLSQLVLDGLLFAGRPCEKLDTTDSFPPKYISEILRDDEPEGGYTHCRRIADELEVEVHGSADYLIMREVCYAVSQRSAAIAAAAIAALLDHLGRPKVTVGVGGALIQFHPIYQQLLQEKLSLIAPENVDWQLKLADEGSAKGAALVAAIADKLHLV